MARELWFIKTTEKTHKIVVNTLFPDTSVVTCSEPGCIFGVSETTLECDHEYGWDRKHYDRWKNEITFDEFCQKFKIENPFKEFTLPKQWCIKNSPKHNQIIRRWFKKENGRDSFDTLNNSVWHFPEYKSDCTTSTNPKPGYTEITFEQFEEYVLLKNKEPQMNLEFTEFLNPTNSTLYKVIEQSDDHVFNTTGHSRSLDFALKYYKVVEVIKHFNGKSESFRRGKVAQVINATSITKGVIYDIFTENGEWCVKLKGHGKYLIKDVKITSVNEALFTIDDIIKAFEQNGVSEQFTRNTLVKYFKG